MGHDFHGMSDTNIRLDLPGIRKLLAECYQKVREFDEVVPLTAGTEHDRTRILLTSGHEDYQRKRQMELLVEQLSNSNQDVEQTLIMSV